MEAVHILAAVVQLAGLLLIVVGVRERARRMKKDY
jgi:hypothetical protein